LAWPADANAKNGEMNNGWPAAAAAPLYLRTVSVAPRAVCSSRARFAQEKIKLANCQGTALDPRHAASGQRFEMFYAGQNQDVRGRLRADDVLEREKKKIRDCHKTIFERKIFFAAIDLHRTDSRRLIGSIAVRTIYRRCDKRRKAFPRGPGVDARIDAAGSSPEKSAETAQRWLKTRHVQEWPSYSE